MRWSHKGIETDFKELDFYFKGIWIWFKGNWHRWEAREKLGSKKGNGFLETEIDFKVSNTFKGMD